MKNHPNIFVYSKHWRRARQQGEVSDYKTRSDLTTPWLSREQLLPALPWLSTRSVMLVCCCCAHKWNHAMRLSHTRSSWFFCACVRLLTPAVGWGDDPWRLWDGHVSAEFREWQLHLQQVLFNLMQIIIQVLQPTHKPSETILVPLGTRWQAEEDIKKSSKNTI